MEEKQKLVPRMEWLNEFARPETAGANSNGNFKKVWSRNVFDIVSKFYSAEITQVRFYTIKKPYDLASRHVLKTGIPINPPFNNRSMDNCFAKCVQVGCILVTVYCQGTNTYCALIDWPHTLDPEDGRELPFNDSTYRYSFYPDNSTFDCSQPHVSWLDTFFQP
ncbi:unnamed protein product [Caenorhabditis auriculariae]|uniref:Uncharacterized protein n=1 Tax=Caenorhabditis auriculariae TaxID=2777116 RepID=A0A8S1H3G4_9PELO|nr:unnamed protein product [Caenorhabditis auriculariae]